MSNSYDPREPAEAEERTYGYLEEGWFVFAAEEDNDKAAADAAEGE